MERSKLISALAVATALGVGSLVLQRWVAETKTAAIVLVAVWFALVGIAIVLMTRTRPETRRVALLSFAAVTVAAAAIGYWTGFRDNEVDEDVVVASAPAADGERPRSGDRKKPATPPGPIQVVAGPFMGADGHAGTGIATVVEEPDSDRFLTFTEFDVDPGAQIEVWLTRDPGETDDRIELGGLKGNVGDQQYELPADADVGEYDTVVLYCTPFTVRIAVAQLAA